MDKNIRLFLWVQINYIFSNYIFSGRARKNVVIKGYNCLVFSAMELFYIHLSIFYALSDLY